MIGHAHHAGRLVTTCQPDDPNRDGPPQHGGEHGERREQVQGDGRVEDAHASGGDVGVRALLDAVEVASRLPAGGNLHEPFEVVAPLAHDLTAECDPGYGDRPPGG